MELTEENRNITDIPVGKENRITRDSLMYKSKIIDLKIFKEELAKIKKKNIILFINDGYYRPNTLEEYDEFINKINSNIKELQTTLEIANKERKELEKKTNG